MTKLIDVWRAEVGSVKPGHLGKELKPFVDQHGVERVERAMRAYVSHQRAIGKEIKLTWFVEQVQLWIGKTCTPVGVEDGAMTPTLELLTRPGRVS